MGTSFPSLVISSITDAGVSGAVAQMGADVLSSAVSLIMGTDVSGMAATL